VELNATRLDTLGAARNLSRNPGDEVKRGRWTGFQAESISGLASWRLKLDTSIGTNDTS
jgi:hypothetical protein